MHHQFLEVQVVDDESIHRILCITSSFDSRSPMERLASTGQYIHSMMQTVPTSSCLHNNAQ